MLPGRFPWHMLLSILVIACCLVEDTSGRYYAGGGRRGYSSHNRRGYDGHRKGSYGSRSYHRYNNRYSSNYGYHKPKPQPKPNYGYYPPSSNICDMTCPPTGTDSCTCTFSSLVGSCAKTVACSQSCCGTTSIQQQTVPLIKACPSRSTCTTVASVTCSSRHLTSSSLTNATTSYTQICIMPNPSGCSSTDATRQCPPAFSCYELTSYPYAGTPNTAGFYCVPTPCFTNPVGSACGLSGTTYTGSCQQMTAPINGVLCKGNCENLLYMHAWRVWRGGAVVWQSSTSCVGSIFSFTVTLAGQLHTLDYCNQDGSWSSESIIRERICTGGEFGVFSQDVTNTCTAVTQPTCTNNYYTQDKYYYHHNYKYY